MFGSSIINWTNAQAYLVMPSNFWLWALASIREPVLILMSTKEYLRVPQLRNEELL